MSEELMDPETKPPATTPDPGGMERAELRTKTYYKMIEWITRNLKKGVDYGTIPRCGDKNVLFKPGAEKVCLFLDVRPTFTKDTDTWDMLGSTNGVIAYVCQLVSNANQVVIGEGRGAARVGERQNQQLPENSAIKFAEKRAQVDAVLRTAALSEMFTQDLEDFAAGPSTSATAGGKGDVPPPPAPDLNGEVTFEKIGKACRTLADCYPEDSGAYDRFVMRANTRRNNKEPLDKILADIETAIRSKS